MLLTPAPLEQRPPVNADPAIVTGCPWYCESARPAPPPRSGPVASQRLPANVDATIFSRPPRAKIAPPPPLAGRVAVREGEVLHHQARGGLVVAVRGGPALLG